MCIERESEEDFKTEPFFTRDSDLGSSLLGVFWTNYFDHVHLYRLVLGSNDQRTKQKERINIQDPKEEEENEREDGS